MRAVHCSGFSCMAGCVVACAGPCHAQVVNAGFETGAFAPWVVSATAQGRSFGDGVAMVDMDAVGPLAPSLAARFIVGQNTPNTGAQGIELTQGVTLLAGRRYRMSVDWHAHALVSFHQSSAGVFSIIVEGEVVAQAVAPVVPHGGRAFGRVDGTFAPPAAGTYAVGVRITRTVPAGEEIFQYVDNVVLEEACPADLDSDGDLANGLTPDGAVDISDLLAFLGAFEAGDARVDLDGDGVEPPNPDGGVDVSDLLYFLLRYGAGC